jgi:hypothetical protein
MHVYSCKTAVDPAGLFVNPSQRTVLLCKSNMDENASWVANQPDPERLPLKSLGGKAGLPLSDTATPQRPKRKQPFLRKGSGSVEKRLEASRQRKYVPKGGFLTGSPEEASIPGSSNACSLQPCRRGSGEAAHSKTPQGGRTALSPDIDPWHEHSGSGALQEHQPDRGDAHSNLSNNVSPVVNQTVRGGECSGARQPLAPILLNSQKDDSWEMLGGTQSGFAPAVRAEMTSELAVLQREDSQRLEGFSSGQMEQGSWNAKQAAEVRLALTCVAKKSRHMFFQLKSLASPNRKIRLCNLNAETGMAFIDLDMNSGKTQGGALCPLSGMPTKFRQ